VINTILYPVLHRF